MGISRSPRRLAGLAGAAGVVLGLLAGGPPAARAQGQLGPVFNPSGAVSWGSTIAATSATGPRPTAPFPARSAG